MGNSGSSGGSTSKRRKRGKRGAAAAAAAAASDLAPAPPLPPSEPGLPPPPHPSTEAALSPADLLHSVEVVIDAHDRGTSGDSPAAHPAAVQTPSPTLISPERAGAVTEGVETEVARVMGAAASAGRPESQPLSIENVTADAGVDARGGGAGGGASSASSDSLPSSRLQCRGSNTAAGTAVAGDTPAQEVGQAGAGPALDPCTDPDDEEEDEEDTDCAGEGVGLVPVRGHRRLPGSAGSSSPTISPHTAGAPLRLYNRTNTPRGLSSGNGSSGGGGGGGLPSPPPPPPPPVHAAGPSSPHEVEGARTASTEGAEGVGSGEACGGRSEPPVPPLFSPAPPPSAPPREGAEGISRGARSHEPWDGHEGVGGVSSLRSGGPTRDGRRPSLLPPPSPPPGRSPPRADSARAEAEAGDDEGAAPVGLTSSRPRGSPDEPRRDPARGGQVGERSGPGTGTAPAPPLAETGGGGGGGGGGDGGRYMPLYSFPTPVNSARHPRRSSQLRRRRHRVSDETPPAGRGGGGEGSSSSNSSSSSSSHRGSDGDGSSADEAVRRGGVGEPVDGATTSTSGRAEHPGSVAGQESDTPSPPSLPDFCEVPRHDRRALVGDGSATGPASPLDPRARSVGGGGSGRYAPRRARARGSVVLATPTLTSAGSGSGGHAPPRGPPGRTLSTPVWQERRTPVTGPHLLGAPPHAGTSSLEGVQDFVPLPDSLDGEEDEGTELWEMHGRGRGGAPAPVRGVAAVAGEGEGGADASSRSSTLSGSTAPTHHASGTATPVPPGLDSGGSAVRAPAAQAWVLPHAALPSHPPPQPPPLMADAAVGGAAPLPRRMIPWGPGRRSLSAGGPTAGSPDPSPAFPSTPNPPPAEQSAEAVHTGAAEMVVGQVPSPPPPSAPAVSESEMGGGGECLWWNRNLRASPLRPTGLTPPLGLLSTRALLHPAEEGVTEEAAETSPTHEEHSGSGGEGGAAGSQPGEQGGCEGHEASGSGSEGGSRRARSDLSDDSPHHCSRDSSGPHQLAESGAAGQREGLGCPPIDPHVGSAPSLADTAAPLPQDSPPPFSHDAHGTRGDDGSRGRVEDEDVGGRSDPAAAVSSSVACHEQGPRPLCGSPATPRPVQSQSNHGDDSDKEDDGGARSIAGVYPTPGSDPLAYAVELLCATEVARRLAIEEGERDIAELYARHLDWAQASMRCAQLARLPLLPQPSLAGERDGEGAAAESTPLAGVTEGGTGGEGGAAALSLSPTGTAARGAGAPTEAQQGPPTVTETVLPVGDSAAARSGPALPCPSLCGSALAPSPSPPSQTSLFPTTSTPAPPTAQAVRRSPSVEVRGEATTAAGDPHPHRPAHARCVFCGELYSASGLCPVAGKSHPFLRALRREEKRAKKAAQALLRGGDVRGAVALLSSMGLVRATPSPSPGQPSPPWLGASVSPPPLRVGDGDPLSRGSHARSESAPGTTLWFSHTGVQETTSPLPLRPGVASEGRPPSPGRIYRL